MSWIDQTLSDFGRRLGLEDLALGPEGFVQLQLGRGGVLGVSPSGDEVAVYLIRTFDHAPAQALERALAQCDFRRRSPFAMQAGLRVDNELVFVARIPQRAFTPPALEQALDLLARAHESARA